MNFGELARSGTAPNAKYKTGSLAPSLGPGTGAQVRPKTRSGGDIDLNDFNVDLRTNKISSQGNDMDNSDFRRIQNGDEYAKAMESFQAAVDNWSGKKDPTVADINSKRPESRNRITKDPKKASVLAAYTQNVPSILLQPTKKVKSVTSSPRAGKTTTANHFNELRAAYGADFVSPITDKVSSPTTVKQSSATSGIAPSSSAAAAAPKGPKLVQIARYQEESIEASTTLRSSSARNPSGHPSGTGDRRDRESGEQPQVRPHTVKSAYLSGGPVEVIRPKKISPTVQSHARSSAGTSRTGSGAYHTSSGNSGTSSAHAAASFHATSHASSNGINNSSSNYTDTRDKILASYSYDLDFEDAEEDIIYVDSPHDQSSSSFTSSPYRGGGGRADPYENSKLPASSGGGGGSVSTMRSAVRSSQMHSEDLAMSPVENYLSEKILSKQSGSGGTGSSSRGNLSSSGGAGAANTPSKRKGSGAAIGASATTSTSEAVYHTESEEGSPRSLKVTPAMEVVELKTGEKLIDTGTGSSGTGGGGGASGGAIERPQSRKLYLGNEKSNSSVSGASKGTIKAPRSAGARYSNFSPTHHPGDPSGSATGFEEGGPFSPDMASSSGALSHGHHPHHHPSYELRRMSSFSAVQVTKPWLEEDHLPVRRPPSRQSSAFPVHLAEPPGSSSGGGGGANATPTASTAAGGGSGGGSAASTPAGGAAIGNSSTEKAVGSGSTANGSGGAPLSSMVTPSKAAASKQRRKDDPSNGMIKTSSTSPPSPEVFLDSTSGDSGSNFNAILTHRPPSRQKVAAQHLFEGLPPSTAGVVVSTAELSSNVVVVGGPVRSSGTNNSRHADAGEVESEDELKVNNNISSSNNNNNNRKLSTSGGGSGVTPAGSVFSIPSTAPTTLSLVPPSTANDMIMSGDLDGPPSTAQPRSRTSTSRAPKNRNGMYYNPRDDGFSELDTNGVGGHLAPFAITVNYGSSGARVMLRDEDSDYIVIEDPYSYNNHERSGGKSSNRVGNGKDNGSSTTNSGHRRLESSDSVEYINLNTAASELSLISNTPRDTSGVAAAGAGGGYHHSSGGNRVAALSWEDHTPTSTSSGGGGGGVSASASHGHLLLPTRPKSVAGPSMKSPAANPRNNNSFYSNAAAAAATNSSNSSSGGQGHSRVKSAGDSSGGGMSNGPRAVTAGAASGGGGNLSLMKPIDGKIMISKGSSPKNINGGWTNEAGTSSATSRNHFVESASQPTLGIRHMQTESPANNSYDTGNYIQQDEDNVTIMSDESCREGADSPLSVRSFTLESSLGEDFLNLFASRR